MLEQNKNLHLNEDLDTPASPDVATTDENLSVPRMFQQTTVPSLGRQIFSVVPINGPTGALFNIRKKDDNTGFELLRNEVEVYNSKSISTGITNEVIQDLRSQYGKEAEFVIGQLLRGLANDAENVHTLAFLDNNSVATDDLMLSDSLNAESNLFEITQKVHELILKMNNETLRTYEAFAVIPATSLAGVMALSNYVGAANDSNERGLFISQIGQTKFYLNPEPTSTTAYVGLRDTTNPSKSSAVFSPYTSDVVVAADPDTGEQNYHIFNRYAITLSPLSTTDNEMLYKFDIIV